MPTSSSDSEGTSQRLPRRRTSTRSTTGRPATKPRSQPSDDEAEAPVPKRDDDFGSGVVEEKAARVAKPRRSRTSEAASAPPASEATSAEPGSGETDKDPPRARRPRREPKARTESTTAETEESGGLIDRSSRAGRTSDRLERKIADVESQTGMRYFSTDELDFGDDDVDERSPRGRSRSRSNDDNDIAARDDVERSVPINDDGGAYDESSGEPRPSEPGADDADGGDRRPPRRRRRRRPRRGPEGSDNSEAGRSNIRDSGRVENSRHSGRVENSRSPGPGPGRFESSRQDGGRGRRSSGSGGSGGGSSSGGRGRRNESSQPRGGSSSRDSGRGRDRGMPRRSSRQIQSSTEVIEGTFEGVLEMHHRGYGFLRDPKKNYAAEDSNPFVSSSVIEKYQLREGVLVRGNVGQGTRNQGPRLQEVELIDGYTPEEYANVKHFDTLTAINPFEQIKLEVGPKPLTMRVMDLLCPIGKGQRALLVAPPRTGKTMLLQDIANSVSINHPEIYLMVLLIDERPEEVTEMRRMVHGEVISSSLDSDVESHVRISQLIIERAKRLAEEGKDVFILLDSITRLARAFNKWSNTGRTATGGLDIRALDIPKKLFGQARRFDEGGSLTVCGTALIDTGGRMDEAIFQEFKGTGNMEMVLSRELADRRIW
ncbi:MAG TPA: transcription termination factor Rho, partial [Planctomycetaceae bacterium]|nr:transcription termination factor Rho [Planctomycetaceae bacterium]